MSCPTTRFLRFPVFCLRFTPVLSNKAVRFNNLAFTLFRRHSKVTMQQMIRLMLMCAISCCLFHIAASHGYMTLQFVKYNNHDSRCADGTFCDTVMFFNVRESPCDPQFRLTADKVTPGGSGLFDYQQSNYYGNLDVIDFTSTFGEISNPVIIAMNYMDNPGSIQITVTVMDHDTSKHDLIDTFAASLIASGPSRRSLTMTSQPMGHTLSLQYWFTCHSNYYGLQCNTYCLAQDSSANGHYTCDSNGQKICLAGWIAAATNCLTPHPCSTGVCQNGATCVPQGESHTCQCRPDFTGANCQQFLNPCLYRNPCKNAATCSLDASRQPQCLCPPQFTGSICDLDVNECLATPCRNDMPCTNTYGGFTCNCTNAHFAGSLCELSVCNGTVCHNNGTCSPGADRVPRCLCSAGFIGTQCETNVDDCAGSPCRNNATCLDLIADFACDCPAGFGGSLCEKNLDDCVGSPCRNGGTCRDLVANFSCNCPAGFSGRWCEVNQDDCVGSRCLNGGTCIDGIANFTCACPPGYSGAICQRAPPAPNATAGLLVGVAPRAAAAGETVSVAAVAGGSTVGVLMLIGVVVFLSVFLLRNRNKNDSPLAEDSNSSAFSNAIYNNAGMAHAAEPADVGDYAYENQDNRISGVDYDNEANPVYEQIVSANQANRAYEADV